MPSLPLIPHVHLAAAARRDLEWLHGLLISDEYNEGGDLTGPQMDLALAALDHDITLLRSYEEDATRWMTFYRCLMTALAGYRREDAR